MKNFIQFLLTPVFFKVIDKKFIKIEIQYIAWSIACFFMAYRSGETVENGLPDSFGDFLRTLLFAIPFLFMVFIVVRARFKPSIKSLFDIPEDWWITRLNLSMQNWFYIRMTAREHRLQKGLLIRFEKKYGVSYENIKAHLLHKIQIVILIGLSLIGFFLGK